MLKTNAKAKNRFGDNVLSLIDQLVQQILLGMVSTKERAKATMKRLAMKSDDGVGGVLDDVVAKQKGKHRGSYKQRAPTADDLQHQNCSSIIRVENGHVHLTSGGMIPEAWKDVFEFLSVNKAPDEWRQGFGNDGMSEERNKKLSYAR